MTNRAELISLIITTSSRFEELLQQRFGASGIGLGQKINSINHRLRPDLAKLLSYVARVRNDAAHKTDFQLPDPGQFLRACDEIESELSSGIPIHVIRIVEQLASSGQLNQTVEPDSRLSKLVSRIVEKGLKWRAERLGLLKARMDRHITDQNAIFDRITMVSSEAAKIELARRLVNLDTRFEATKDKVRKISDLSDIESRVKVRLSRTWRSDRNLATEDIKKMELHWLNQRSGEPPPRMLDAHSIRHAMQQCLARPEMQQQIQAIQRCAKMLLETNLPVQVNPS